MCNRYAQTSDSARIRLNTLGERQLTLTPRFNIAPTQTVDVVLMERGELVHKRMTWGWHHKKFGPITNAQAETARLKMFKEAWASRRCIVPATGFYEWKAGTPAQPYLISMATRKLFWFAGLYQDGEVLILTGPASSFLRSIHDRQPVVLPEKELEWWLADATGREAEGWGVIRRGVSITAFEAEPVTPQMSNPRFESPECVQPITPAQGDLIGLAIDDPAYRWREMSDGPPIAKDVDLLMEDDETTTGQFDGKNWTWTRAENSRPVRWRSKRDALHMNTNAHGI